MRKPHRALDDGITACLPRPVASRRRLRLVVLLLLDLSCLLLIWTYDSLLTGLAHRFHVEDPLVPCDAIVVLLSGWPDRPEKAAELYGHGLAPLILLGQTKRVPDDGTAYNRHILMQNGVPAEAIRILPGAVVKSTHDEALRVRDYVQTHAVRRIIVVTTAYHTARTRWTFRRVLQDLGTEVRMAASSDLRFTEADWYMRGEGIKQYLSEALKTAYYRLVY
jgi:uncharacterized SAM-binding protein YcdF (DUF218 family)